ncbi:ABC transporter ATP-binding protein [Candidatus Poriferisodalis sp.]|uniref:ABC transporter ATP-binding protein n=1 Tax=Candidatus Poriferisodalis sp. TaxID=3101277 RepID=UPI003B59B2BA
MAEGLQLRNVSKTFTAPEGDIVRALDDVSLDVASNEFVVLLGPSGCGKTTLLRTIAGLENVDSGEIHLDGERLDETAPFRRAVNTVFQSYALFPFLTVERNIAFGLEMEKRPRAEIRERVAEMLDLVELSGFAKRTPAQMSGGQQQRVALARALAKRPSMLLLDEPLGALDLKLRRQMQTELKRIQRSTGIAFVFVTHGQEEALALGDRIAVLNAGRIVQIGTPQEIYEAPATRFVADFIGETNLLPVTYDADGTLTVAGQWKLHLAGVGDIDEATVATADSVSLAVRPERVSLHPDGHLRGVVAETAYLGADVHLTIDLGNGLRINVREDAQDHSVDVGDSVSLRIEPRHTRILTS